MNLEFVKVVLSIFSETDRTSMHALGRAEFKLAAVSNHRNISDYLHPWSYTLINTMINLLPSRLSVRSTQ